MIDNTILFVDPLEENWAMKNDLHICPYCKQMVPLYSKGGLKGEDICPACNEKYCFVNKRLNCSYKRISAMKIANCKCGAGKPSSFYYDGFIRIECPECGQEGYFKETTTDAINDWNAQNTDQHGQQIKRQIIEWVEWDGDVEHLPQIGTRIYYRAPSEINGKPCVCAGEWKVVRGYPCVCFWRCSGEDGTPKEEVHIWIKKGDLLAVVE